MSDFQPTTETFAATDDAMKLWRIHHPNRRVPNNHDHAAERHLIAQAFSGLNPASIALVAESVLDASKGHWPNIVEVKSAARAFRMRQKAREADHAQHGEPETLPDAIADAQLAQCHTILAALGQDGPEVSRESKNRLIAATADALITGLQRAVRDGRLPVSRITDFRDGSWPTTPQLAALVRDLDARGSIDLKGKAAQMMGAA